jgi:hypothetical protein
MSTAPHTNDISPSERTSHEKSDVRGSAACGDAPRGANPAGA